MQKRPNVLIFLPDQHSYFPTLPDHICPMPNVDRLASRGVRCTNSFTPTPICTPARTSLVTGLYPHRHLLIQNAHAPLVVAEAPPQGVPTLGEVFRQAGYHTAYVGKWHVGKTEPGEYGFDYVAGKKSSRKKMMGRAELADAVHVPGEAEDRPLAATVVGVPPEEFEPFLAAEDGARFIEAHCSERPGEPFFLVVSCGPPHVPWHAPEPFASLVDPASVPEPPNYGDSLQDKPVTYRKHYNGVNFGRIKDDWPLMARALAKYYGCCAMVDAAFGSLLDAVERAGVLDETIVVYTSDHGELAGAHGLYGKDELLCEELVRIPLVMAGPGIAPGRFEAPITLCDLFATLAALAGIEAPRPADSRDLTPLLRLDESSRPSGAELLDAEPVVFQHHGATYHFNSVRGIRTARYKYVYRPHEVDELYDLEKDPHECTNFAGDPAYAGVLYELRLRLLNWMKEREDFVYHGAARVFSGIYRKREWDW